MVENQHEQIKGYRDLSQDEINVINDIKYAEGDLSDIYHNVAGLVGIDRRWLAVARTHFEEGFSALVRAVAQPRSPFNPDKDNSTNG